MIIDGRQKGNLDFMKQKRNNEDTIKLRMKVLWSLTVLLVTTVLLTCIPYTKLKKNELEDTIDFSRHWDVEIDGKTIAQDVTLPYVISDSVSEKYAITNIMPETGFLVDTLAFRSFHQNIQIYIDNEIVYDDEFKAILPNQTTVGSRNLSITLPSGIAGKTIRIEFRKLVPQRECGIQSIVIENVLEEQNVFYRYDIGLFLLMLATLSLGIAMAVMAIIYNGYYKNYMILVHTAFFVIVACVWVLCSHHETQSITKNYVLLHNLEYIALYAMPVLLWNYLVISVETKEYKLNVIDEKHKKVANKVLEFMYYFFDLSLLLKLFGVCDFYYLLKLFYIIVVCNILVFSILVLDGFRKKSVYQKIAILIFFTFFIGAIASMISYNEYTTTKIMTYFYVFGMYGLSVHMIAVFFYIIKERLRVSIESEMYQKVAYSDILTAAFSRRKWEEDLYLINKEIDTYDSLVLVVIDVNNLKLVNDSYGHESGDYLLKKVVAELIEEFHGVGKVYRIGGDEFSIVCPNMKENEVIESLKTAQDKLKNIDSTNPIYIAYGLKQYKRGEYFDLHNMQRVADSNMYAQKRAMKNEI